MVGHDKFRHGLFQKTGPELVLFGLLCETQVPMLPRTLPIWQSIIDGNSHPFLRASGQVTTKEQGNPQPFWSSCQAIFGDHWRMQHSWTIWLCLPQNHDFSGKMMTNTQIWAVIPQILCQTYLFVSFCYLVLGSNHKGTMLSRVSGVPQSADHRAWCHSVHLPSMSVASEEIFT